jgi:integrase/recombinase XerD
MLEQYFRRRHVVTRLRAEPLGQLLEEFAVYLHNHGHSTFTVQGYLWATERFGRWLALHKIEIEAVNEGLLQSFLQDQASRRSKHKPPKLSVDARAGLHHFLRMLRRNEHVPATPTRPITPRDAILAEYDRYLQNVRGLAPATRRYRVRYARAFLDGTFGNGRIRWCRLRPKHIHDFVVEFARSGRCAAAGVAACSLRSFLRWLQLQGHCRAGLIAAVPCFRRWRHATLPKVMTDDQVRCLLNTFDRSKPVGRRDYALALCQVDLGLRVSEVASLTLDDCNWRQGTICITGGKARRGRILPLSKRVGQALADYLRRGRPNTTCRAFCVRHTVSAGTPLSNELIRGVVCRAFARVQGCAQWTGTHVLRHTAATRMHRRGASLKQVADVLGHLCLDTTALYIKVDLERLTAVALPWPEGKVQS